jgi:membrane associated rhomboid family serine protease
VTSSNLTRPTGQSGRARLATRWEDAAGGVRLVIGMLAFMWVAWVVDALDHYHLNQYGIIPRNVGHLYGIVTSPFLHASFGHIFGNSIPFLILGLVIATSGVSRVITVTLITMIIGGLGVWLTAGANTDTVGASGLVFGFAAYLVARGVFSRNPMELFIGLVVGALFGLSLLSDLIPRSGVSWQGHLFGAIAGVIAAALLSGGAARRSISGRPAPIPVSRTV